MHSQPIIFLWLHSVEPLLANSFIFENPSHVSQSLWVLRRARPSRKTLQGPADLYYSSSHLLIETNRLFPKISQLPWYTALTIWVNIVLEFRWFGISGYPGVVHLVHEFQISGSKHLDSVGCLSMEIPQLQRVIGILQSIRTNKIEEPRSFRTLQWGSVLAGKSH